MKMRNVYCPAKALFLLICFGVGAPALAQRSWDDSGNDASKEWSIFGNWDPDGTPSGEPITIGNLANAANDTTLVDLNFTIDSLTVSNGADVDTSGNKLTVNGVTTIGGSGVSILVRPRSAGDQIGLDSEGITVNADAVLSLQGETGSTAGGIVELESGLFQINPNGDAGGHGTIRLINAATAGQAMENSGRLFVSSRPGTVFGVLPGTLTISDNGTGTGTLDLDGDGEDGFVDVDDGGIVLFTTSLTLIVDVPLDDPFSGQMDIGNGDTVNFMSSWSMGAGGANPAVLNFNGTGTHTLTGGTLTVAGSTTAVNANAGTTVFEGNLTFNEGNFTVGDGATVQFDRTTMFVDATDFTNAGTWNIVINATTNIGDATVAAGEDFNWDGSDSVANVTTVNATGVLNINVENVDAGASDTYDGTLTMNSGNVDVQVADGSWIMNGDLNMNNTAGDIPVLSGDSVAIGADNGSLNANLNVGGTGISQISAPVTFQADADVNIAAGATLELNANATFNSVNGGNNARFIGSGVLLLDGGSNTVNETTTIDMPNGRVDLDGAGGILIVGAQSLTIGTGINADVDLTLNVAGIDTADNSFGKTNLFGSDTIVINDFSSLIVNLTAPDAEWTLNAGAILNVNAPGGMLGGGGVQGSDFNMAGTTNIDGNSIWTARTDISGTVNVALGGSLNLRGGTLVDTNRLVAGTITGDGALRALVDEGLVGFGTIATDVEFRNNTVLLADDGILTLTAASVLAEVGVIGTAHTDGVLNVANAWNTNVANNDVRLQGGEIRGATITNSAAFGINGFGLLSARVLNNTRIDAEGGTLIVQTAANNNDLDGAGNGALQALTGNLEIRDDAQVLFTGTVVANAGREVFANGFELQFEPAADLNLTNGLYRSTNATNFGGTMQVLAGGDSRIEVGGNFVFENGSSTTLTGNLRLDNPNTQVQVGATFAGGGDLINLDMRQLSLVDGANVGVLVDNRGVLQIAGAAAGRADLSDFQQSATGQLNVDLSGTALNAFDRLVISGSAQLNGELDVSLFGGFTPVMGNTFTILSAVGGVSGTFASITPPPLGAGLTLGVQYNPTNVVLQILAALLGDYNQDNVVDAADYVFWRDTLGQAVTPLSGADGDGDGMVDDGDYDVWRAHFGQTAGSAAATSAAAPEPGMIVILGGAILIGITIRRGRV